MVLVARGCVGWIVMGLNGRTRGIAKLSRGSLVPFPMLPEPQRKQSLIPWTLLVLAAVNLAIAVAVADYRPAKPFGFRLGPAINGGLHAQLVVLGIVASLTPQRAIYGLFIGVAFSLLRGLATWTNRDLVNVFVGLDEALRTLAILAVLQGLRHITGWRLTNQPRADNRTGQFQIAEWLEWTTTIGIALGCLMWVHSTLPDHVRDCIFVVDYFLELVPLPLIAVPVALAILAETSPNRWNILALVLWCSLVAVGLFFADLRHKVTPRILLAMLPHNGAPYLTAFMAVTMLNALVLRWCGYRWR